MRTSTRLRLILLLALLLWSRDAWAEPLKFRVRLDADVARQPVTGRLFVFLSTRRSQPRFGPDWFRPEPFFAVDVEQFQPGTSRDLDGQADGFPAPLPQLPPGDYYIQAVLDHSFDVPQPGQAPGNYYSDAIQASLDPSKGGVVRLTLARVVDPPELPESPWIEELRVSSKRLSQFYNRQVVEPATIVLPQSYFDQPERRYPVMYTISGFGGDNRTMARRYASTPPALVGGEVEFICVLLAGQCKWGHHEYANSATNGPRGDALVQEIIPEIDRRYRTVPQPSARMLTGHSSGGWASLWLQINYPDMFGGTWSVAPDPVDFRDFQQVDLYVDPPLNLYRDPQGNPRPIARRRKTPFVWFEPFVHMDDVLKRGCQFRSFEAVFSPLGPDGLPEKLCDRTTGRIDPAVAQAWRKYDIRLILENNWPTLRPKLQGKLHIFAAQYDTFYLEGAVQRLAETLRQLGSDADVTIVPGKDHSSILTADLYRQIRVEMSRAFREHSQP